MTNIIIIGLLISIIFYEITDISPGGIIVPGLMVLYFNQVDRMIYTVVIAIISYLVVKWASRYFIIFGRRRFVLLIVISLVINFVLQLLLKSFSISMLNVSIIGYTIAGLIANDFYKQGVKKTLPALVIVVGIVELIGIMIQYWG
ncbi:MAG TPA: poly-gamma-glutamate biosynthesis protein PgsC [Bacilli bacterium]|jgi:poly-gamma-glutamate biosynthesis protein PgsC/CapC|nr:poly-gamma-glutamate biosynthesis protein PgsC [Acholeplasmataceae bacterium]OQB66168.1 MAG: Capsule biosynthesis protein CapC [Tenericutes bacterium ADurb.Bin140]HOE77126.1 poly-gamma-glutamate biosynthesis protein PgsC [Bacilli bacterium]HON63715.1 poly-gamma-glutamate biosynthesis protein PgsC [Bacilli bacterium]HPD11843.1 poly-gamma-glutamate biosynthesis protein PgsC [Bacilli bacterium]